MYALEFVFIQYVFTARFKTETIRFLERINEFEGLPSLPGLTGLLYLSVMTRPDISFVVNMLARFATNPSRTAWQAMNIC